jgi:hypothetical protein
VRCRLRCTTGEIRQVGASLGDELIRKGSLAATVGLARGLLHGDLLPEVRVIATWR